MSSFDTVSRELDADKRAKLTHDLGQKLYENYHGVMLGMKSTAWVVSKKVGSWQTLAYVPMENNYEYVTRPAERRSRGRRTVD